MEKPGAQEDRTTGVVRILIGASTSPRPLNAVGNLLDAADLPTAVEVVAFADGLDAVLAGSPAAALTARLQERGVRFSVCANTLRAQRIAAERLLPGVRVVAAAVWHIARRQHDGWVYLPM